MIIHCTEFLDDFILTFQIEGFRDLENISRNILTKEINLKVNTHENFAGVNSEKFLFVWTDVNLVDFNVRSVNICWGSIEGLGFRARNVLNSLNS